MAFANTLGKRRLRIGLSSGALPECRLAIWFVRLLHERQLVPSKTEACLRTGVHRFPEDEVRGQPL